MKKNKKSEIDEDFNKNKKDEEIEDINKFTFDIDSYQNKINGIKEDLKKEGLINEYKKEENKDIIQNYSIFKNAMNSEEKGIKKTKELFSDLKKLASNSPIKEVKKSGKAKPIVQQKIKPKRTHKELGEIEKKPKKAVK